MQTAEDLQMDEEDLIENTAGTSRQSGDEMNDVDPDAQNVRKGGISRNESIDEWETSSEIGDSIQPLAVSAPKKIPYKPAAIPTFSQLHRRPPDEDIDEEEEEDCDWDEDDIDINDESFMESEDRGRAATDSVAVKRVAVAPPELLARRRSSVGPVRVVTFKKGKPGWKQFEKQRRPIKPLEGQLSATCPLPDTGPAAPPPVQRRGSLRIQQTISQWASMAIVQSSYLLGFERAHFYFHDVARSQLLFQPAAHAASRSVEGEWIALPIDSGLVGYSIKLGRLLNNANAVDDPRFHSKDDRAATFVVKNVICCPIFRGAGGTDDVLGCLELINKTGSKGKGGARGGFTFSDEDERTLTAVCLRIGGSKAPSPEMLAVFLDWVHSQVEPTSSTDKLEGDVHAPTGTSPRPRKKKRSSADELQHQLEIGFKSAFKAAVQAEKLRNLGIVNHGNLAHLFPGIFGNEEDPALHEELSGPIRQPRGSLGVPKVTSTPSSSLHSTHELRASCPESKESLHARTNAMKIASQKLQVQAGHPEEKVVTRPHAPSTIQPSSAKSNPRRVIAKRLSGSPSDKQKRLSSTEGTEKAGVDDSGRSVVGIVRRKSKVLVEALSCMIYSPGAERPKMRVSS